MAPASIGRMKACYIEEGRVPLPPDCHESQAAPGRPPHFRPPMYYVQRDAYIETEVKFSFSYWRAKCLFEFLCSFCIFRKPVHTGMRLLFSLNYCYNRRLNRLISYINCEKSFMQLFFFYFTSEW